MKTVFGVFLGVLIIPHLCLAGSGAGAINLSFNTSARFEGMGGAGVGAPWGSDTNHWANPALLAFRLGVHYLDFRSELAQGLADDLFLTNHELTLGVYGATLLLATGPVEGNFLDMGSQVGTDENGNPTGTFNSYMESTSWGIGVDLVPMLDRLLKQPNGGFTQYASLAIGFNRHEFKDKLASDDFLQDTQGSTGSGSSTDTGFVIRVTTPKLDAGQFNFVGGLAYGSSLLSNTDDFINRPGADSSDPFPRAYLKGWSIHAAVELPESMINQTTSSITSLFLQSINPVFTFTRTIQLNEPGYVWSNENLTYAYEHDESGAQEEKSNGLEIGLLNTFYYRKGHLKALYGDIDADTSGWGINLQAGLMGGFRYDEATVPQALGLPTVERRSWSIWLDPVAIMNR